MMRTSYAPPRQYLVVAVLGLVILAFLTYSLPPYTVGDTRVPASFAWQYPVLVLHVVCGAVAMMCVPAQIWPGLRRRRPHWHRRVGRVYVAATVPAAATALMLGVTTPFGPIVGTSNTVLGALWLWSAIAGHQAARRRDHRTHRRRMLYSATLALSIITNRLWTPMFIVALQPLQDTVFGGRERYYIWFTAGLGAWLGWTVPLLAVHMWLHRRVISVVP